MHLLCGENNMDTQRNRKVRAVRTGNMFTYWINKVARRATSKLRKFHRSIYNFIQLQQQQPPVCMRHISLIHNAIFKWWLIHGSCVCERERARVRFDSRSGVVATTSIGHSLNPFSFIRTYKNDLKWNFQMCEWKVINPLIKRKRRSFASARTNARTFDAIDFDSSTKKIELKCIEWTVILVSLFTSHSNGLNASAFVMYYACLTSNS